MLLFLFSLCSTASPLYNAILYQDLSLLQSNQDQENMYYWNTLAYLSPENEARYQDLSKESIDVQKNQAQSLLLSRSNPQEIGEMYARTTDPQVLWILLH